MSTSFTKGYNGMPGQWFNGQHVVARLPEPGTVHTVIKVATVSIKDTYSQSQPQ
jgi:hypothetical protein